MAAATLAQVPLGHGVHAWIPQAPAGDVVLLGHAAGTPASVQYCPCKTARSGADGVGWGGVGWGGGRHSTP